MHDARSLGALLLVFSFTPPAVAQDDSPLVMADGRLIFSGWVGGAYQAAEISGGDVGRGALLFRPSVDFALTERDRLHATLAFADGDAVNRRTPFTSAPWAADLEANTEDINGSGRDHLLTAWYRREIELGEDSLALTGGLIDATEYVGQNPYSNDERTQFMNAALVNGPGGFAPSYDFGAAAEWTSNGPWRVNGVVMHVNENPDGNGFGYVAGQVGYETRSSLGEGHYRVFASTTTTDFLDPSGTSRESRRAGFFSAGQELGEALALWTRLGVQDREASVDHGTLYSGGLNIDGSLWGRDDDDIGIASAILDDGNSGVTRSSVSEAYLRLMLPRRFALTFDVQYVSDHFAAAADVDGWIFGLRLGVGF